MLVTVKIFMYNGYSMEGVEGASPNPGKAMERESAGIKPAEAGGVPTPPVEGLAPKKDFSEVDSPRSELSRRKQALETSTTASIQKITELGIGLTAKPTIPSEGEAVQSTAVVPLSVIEDKVPERPSYYAQEHQDPESSLREASTFERSIDTELTQLSEQQSALDREIAEMETTLQAKNAEITDDITANVLKRKFVAVRDYKKRQRLREEIAQLEGQLSTAKLVTKSGLEREAERRGKVRERIQGRKEELFVSLVNKIATDIRSGYLEFGAEVPQDPTLVQQLNESLVREKILPVVERLKESGEITEEQAKEYVSLIRDHFKDGPLNVNRDTEDVQQRKQERRQKWQDLRHDMPYSSDLRQAEFDIGLRFDDLVFNNPDAGYHEVFRFLSVHEAYQRLQALSATIDSLPIAQELKDKALARVRAVITPTNYDGRPYDVREIEYNPQEKVPLDLEQVSAGVSGKVLLPWDAENKWSAVKSNPEILQVYGQEVWGTLEQKLAETSIKELLITREHTDASITLGLRLFWLAEQNPELRVKLAPFIIMNSWREPGGSGEYPFLGQGHMTSRESRVYKFISTLSDQDVSQLEAQNIPGLTQTIKTVRENPDNFLFPQVDNPQWTSLVQAYARRFRLSINDAREILSDMKPGSEETHKGLRLVLNQLKIDSSILDWDNRRIDNPAHREVEEGLAKLCLHLMQTGDEANQFFVLGLFKRLDTDLGAAYPILGSILKSTQNAVLQEQILETVLFRYHDLNASLVVLEAFPSLTETVRQKVTEEIAPKLLSNFLAGDEVLPQHLDLLARALNRPSEDVRLGMQFIKSINQQSYGYYYDEKRLGDYITLAKRPEVLDFIKELQPFGFSFSIEHASTILEMLPHREELLTTIAEIKGMLPDYNYQFAQEYAFNRETNEGEYKYIYDPFESLVRTWSVDKVFDALDKIQKEKGSFSHRFANGLLHRLRADDPLLRGLPEDKTRITPEIQETFYSSLQRMVTELSGTDGELRDFRSFYLNSKVLAYVARQPERVDEILSLPSRHPNFFRLVNYGGPLFSNRELIIQDIFSNGNAVGRLRQIESIFSTKVPYWKQLYLFTETRIGDALAGSRSEYPVTQIGSVSLESLVNQHIALKQQNPEGLTRLEAVIDAAQHGVISKLINGEIASVPFSTLTGQYKRLVFRDSLKRTIETSRNNEAKLMADQRNRLNAQPELRINGSTYIHGSPVDVVESVLLSGNLPKEALGEGAATDSYPFQVDFSNISQDLVNPDQDLEEIINSTISRSYGTNGNLGINGQIFYMYDRVNTFYEAGKQYGPQARHSLILGGMPATEISGIILRNSETTLNRVKRSVLENGFYIPVYDIKGNLLFTPEEYDETRLAQNLAVPVEVWDYSLKTGEQRGSNPGGEFTVPTERGPIRYYVKFASPEQTDKAWNEQLADNIYRYLGYAVPDTKIVKVAGSYGHASVLLPTDAEVNLAELRQGFLVDALLANWDVVANSGNTVSSGGRLVRIDNGGAILFRARGERKPAFGEIVTELETMKSGYPGLTQADIQSQLTLLRERFTDAAIDQLVDSVRLSQADRDSLKTTLRQRRDYVISYYSETQVQPATEEMTEQRKMIESELRSEELNDEVISEIIPEWSRLVSEEGYQHNGVLLGQHIKDAVSALKYLPEYWSLSDREKSLALVATLFHDLGKPTGRKAQNIPRDFEHEVPSAQLAAEYMRRFGYSEPDIRTVIQVIINDGIVSDIARGKVRDPRKNLTPEQFREAVGNNLSVMRVLKAVNRADVIGTVGVNGFSTIEQAYNQYFDQLEQQSV